MPPLFRSRARLIGFALVVSSLGAIGFLPLFSGPGYESAFAAGLLVPSIVAVVTALETAAVRARPIEAFWRGVEIGMGLALAAYLTTLLHGLRTGFCDVADGSMQFALGPGAGAVLAGVWGAFVGEVAGHRKGRRARRAVAVSLGLLAPLGSIGVSVFRFYTSPMVFAYDPFVGYFSGTLYDTIVDFSGLVTYRVGSAATLLCAALLAARVERSAEGRLALRARPPIAVAAFFALLAASLVSTARGDKLLHWQTAATIAETLGASWRGARCDVVYPRTMEEADAARFGRECDAHVELGERWLGAPVGFRIKAYLFRDSAQKDALMGAADTYIAKPWRREIYLQQAGYPQPALGHEVIHVLAGHFARGPFKVAGALGGWLPDPGLIEGIAVAASPPEGDLRPRDWAKAMKDLGILPPLSRLFALGFLGVSSATAYTVSGAFVGYIKERFGAATIRAWYGGQGLPELTGRSWADLERAWHEDLDRVELPAAASAQAKARFDKPAIFGRRCPHVVDECKSEAEGLRAQGDHEGAIQRYREALDLDPGDAGLRIAIAKSKLRLGRMGDAVSSLEAIAADESVVRHVRDRALEELGDLALGSGKSDAAVVHYREVMARTLNEDALRTLEVKIAAARDERARPAVIELLIGAPDRGPDKVRAAELLGAWAEGAPEDGMPHYLLGRHYFGAGQLAEAALKLDKALARQISVPRVRVEAERLRMVVACGMGEAAEARRFFSVYAAEPELGASRRETAESLIERCVGQPPTAARTPSPVLSSWTPPPGKESGGVGAGDGAAGMGPGAGDVGSAGGTPDAGR